MSEISPSDQSTVSRFLNITIRAAAGIGVALLLGWYFAKSYVYIDSIRQTSGDIMGTTYYVKCFTGVTEAGWKSANEAVLEELTRIDGLMSTFKTDSEVTKFNQSDSTEWFPVSVETAEVVKLSKEISALTEGMFDITINPLVQLWGFGSQSVPSSSPTQERIEHVLQFVGIDKLEVRLEPPAIRKTVPGLQIDLSAVAKGYAVDRVGGVLEKQGISNYMIEVGGETRSKGTKKGREPWLMGIQEPKISKGSLLQQPITEVVNLHDQALATSGDYFNFHEFEGEQYTHIINPKTGIPQKVVFENGRPSEQIGSVSVIDPSCAKADALATGFFLLGLEKGLAVADANDIPVLFIVRTYQTDTSFKKVGSKAFESGKWCVKVKK